MKKTIFTALAIALPLALNAAVQSNAGIIFPALEIGAGARSAGMGDAFTAVADDAGAPYWNPAGLAWARSAQVTLTYDQWFVDSYYQHLMAVVPLASGAIGADLFYMNYGSFNRVDSSGVQTGPAIKPTNMEGLLSYGIKLGSRFSIGAGAKFISQSLGDSTGSGFAADLGIRYAADRFMLGLSGVNIGTAGQYALPMSIRAGAGFEVVSAGEHNLLLAADGRYTINDTPEINAGVEYVYADKLSVRGGYKFLLGQDNLTGLKGFTAGAGLKFGSFGFDYAFTPYGELGVANRAAVTYSFGKPEEQQPKAKVKAVAKTQKELSEMMTQTADIENAGRLKDAEHNYLIIIGYDKNYAPAYKRLGAVYYKENRKVEAIKTFDAYLQLKPDDTTVANWVKKHRGEK
jgi:hypothetical protein